MRVYLIQTVQIWFFIVEIIQSNREKFSDNTLSILMMIGVEMSLNTCEEDFKILNFRFKTRKGKSISYYSVEEQADDDGFVIVSEKKPEPLFNLKDLFEI